jgi:chlorophyllide a reductase subunit Z
MDKVDATPAREHRELPWSAEAKALFDRVLAGEPVLVRISAAKRLRDGVERAARAAGEAEVGVERLRSVAGPAALALEPA